MDRRKFAVAIAAILPLAACDEPQPVNGYSDSNTVSGGGRYGILSDGILSVRTCAICAALVMDDEAILEKHRRYHEKPLTT